MKRQWKYKVFLDFLTVRGAQIFIAMLLERDKIKRKQISICTVVSQVKNENQRRSDKIRDSGKL